MHAETWLPCPLLGRVEPMRDNEIVKQAANNNALWCDAICAAHRGAGEFHETYWLTRLGAPARYPDLVTLTGSTGVGEQIAAISSLTQRPRQGGWSVKDCFHSLDLYGLGFEPLFDAEWLSATSPADHGRPATGEPQWTQISLESDLVRWEQAWASAEMGAEERRTFMPCLLSAPDIHIMSARIDGALVGGGVLNAGAGVLGFSNLFASKIDLETIWRGLARAAREAFPHLPFIAYECGEALAAAQRAGFVASGPLRIWRRAG
jgi:hypothetical protein